MLRPFILTLVLPAVLVAQGAPPRPARPAPGVPPATPAPRPAPAPRAPRALEAWPELAELHAERMRLDMELSGLAALADIDHARLAEDARLAAKMAMADLDVARLADEAKLAAGVAMADLDVKRIADEARLHALDAERMAFEMRFDAAKPMPAPMPLLPPRLDPPRGLAMHPPAPWAQEDPADSLYRQAREAMNRGEYRRSAQLFASLQQRFPNSRYAPDAHYWQALSLYRIGGDADLRQALQSLNEMRTKYPSNRQADDAAALRARIVGVLASRGDANARRELEELNRSGTPTCDPEEQQVRAEAFSAIFRADPGNGAEVTRQVLARRDPCSAQLRKRAVYMLGEKGDESTIATLIDVVRNDPDDEVRESAMAWLGRSGNDRAITTLEEILRTSNDEKMQRSAVRSLGQSSNPRARQAVRALIERNDASVNLRREAISNFTSRERATAEDAAYLRQLYGRVTDTRLKQSIVAGIIRTDAPENDAWLLALAGNENEPSEARQYALSSFANSRTPIATVVRAYDGVSDRRLREQLINVLGRRPEPQATDKLIDIVKTGTDPNIRRQAIQALSNKKDPRTTQLLMELLNK